MQMISRVSYGGWANCYRLSNGETELIATSDVGPRVIRYGFVGGQNLFVEIPDQLGKSGEPWWMMRGGHRLWAAPEIKPDTYALDNGPVDARIDGDTLVLTQAVEPETGFQKQMVLSYEADGSVKVVHRLINRGTRTPRIAPWALSQMARGGTGIVLFPGRGGHSEQLLPTNPLTMWAYTNFADARWHFTKQYLVLRQDPNDSSPQKAGLFNEQTRAAYLLGHDLFIKRSEAVRDAAYPDYGCSFEMFTNNDFLELETLGPLVDFQPYLTIEHVERWSLHGGISLPALTDEQIDRVIKPLF